eukprot:gene8612-1025_t
MTSTFPAIRSSSILERQRSAFTRMFGSPTSWKVLVYDKPGQDVLATALTVKELREHGITLHRMLGSDQEPLLDVPAVYLCAATKENINLICEEIRQHTYETYELNFLTSIPRLLLEEMAENTVDASCADQVTKVYDMCLEDDFFTLTEGDDMSLSYLQLNNANVRDDEMEALVNRIVDSIFSVFVTMGTIPIIRCSPRNAAQFVAEGLDRKFREHLRNKGHSLFADRHMDESGSFARPVLILLDRGLDIPTIMHHTWSYQALVHDVLGIRANQSSIREIGEDGQEKVTQVTFDKNDLFWHTNRGNAFPIVTQAVQDELAACRQKEKEINGCLESSTGDNAEGLTSAISTLPELLKQKSFLTMHLNILTSLMKAIEVRKLDDLYQLEEEVMNKKSLSHPILEMIRDEEAGTILDRLRLYIIYLLDGTVSADEQRQCEDALRCQGCSMDALTFIQYLQDMQKAHHQPSTVQPNHAGSLFSLAGKTLQTGASFWSKSVKALSPTYGDLPITRIVDAIMSTKQDDLVSNYLYFDPKRVKPSKDATRLQQQSHNFEQAVVFMVGGGNYTEYQNLRDYCRRHEDKHVIYGVSQLVRAEEFVDQMTQLGKMLRSRNRI